MKKIKVGFDFDEPWYPWYDLAHKASVEAGLAMPEHEPTSWAPHNTYGCRLEEWIAVLDAEVHKPNGMYLQDMKPGVADLVKTLYNRGYEIHVVTARGSFGTDEKTREKIKRLTKTSIIRAGIPYTSLTFSKDKVPVCKKLGLDWFIDDAPHNFDPLLEAGINVFLLDERWNQDHPEKPYPNGRRVNSLEEYVRIIMDTVQLERDRRIPTGANAMWQ